MTKSDKEYLEQLLKVENKRAIITKENMKYRVDIFKPNCINSSVRIYTTSLEKAKMKLLSLGISKFIIRGC